MSDLPIGRRILSDLVLYSKYAKYLPDEARRESWDENVDRTKQTHLDTYRARLDPENFKKLETKVEDVFENYVRPKKILGSMRMAQFAGKPVQLSPNRAFNCSYFPIDDVAAFSEAMFLLLGGTGIGYSVQRHHVEQLAPIKKPTKTRRYLIGDSIEGWADAVKVLMKAYFTDYDYAPVFDPRDVRPKGARLITSGGKAPGPDPLMRSLYKIEDLLETKRNGDKLTPFEAHLIMCYIADAVLSGGIRRAAMISLFDNDDEEMLTAKSGEWWVRHPELARSNNSAVLVRGVHGKNEFDRVMDALEHSGAGEPGVYWTFDKNMGTNPCGEVALNAHVFCNLVDINTTDIYNQEEMVARSEAASFLSTLQAGYTDFHYLRPVWRERSEEDALIGVGATGIASGNFTRFDLEAAAEAVKRVNAETAELIGINTAARTTTVKPAGSTSALLGSSSGIHAWHAPYYIRRMRVNKTEALYTYLYVHHNELLEDDVFDPNSAVISIPTAAPEGAITRHDETAVDFLNRVGDVYDRWVKPGHRRGANTNNVSATVSVRAAEWPAVREWMWDNRERYNGLSLLPHDESEHTYVQAPFEEITAEEYHKLVARLSDIDLTQVVELVDETDLQGEIACGGPDGACEIV